MIVGRQTLPPNTLQELIAWLKANGDKATAATVGAGSPGHVSGIHFQNVTGTRFQFVPYRGGGPANQDLVGGQVDLRIGAEASQMLPHIRAGRTKAYAVMSKQRWPALPDLPTADEAGVSGRPYLGVDRALGAERHAEGYRREAQRRGCADPGRPGRRQRITDVGFEIPSRDQLTPEALAAFHKAETGKWWPIIKAANIKAE